MPSQKIPQRQNFKSFEKFKTNQVSNIKDKLELLKKAQEKTDAIANETKKVDLTSDKKTEADLKDTDYVWIGIGIDITPSTSIFSQLSKLNTKLNQEFDSSYNLELIPLHINLYDLNISKNNVEKAKAVLKEIIHKSNTLTIKLNKISYFEHGSIFVMCELNELLKTLERDIVEAIAPFKEISGTEEYWQPWRQYTEQQKVYREQYGNPHVLEAFIPHITIGYIKKEKAELEKIASQLNEKFKPLEFTVKQISMATQNPDEEVVERTIYNVDQ